MSEDRQSFFTIGQFAAIHGVTKKTLMWYDETGLLKPDVIGENRYRYYTYRQSSVLESILMLRELNVSIDEIKAFLSERSAEGMERLLQEKITELEAHISHLKSMHQILQSRHQDMMTLLHLDLNEILIVEKKKCYLSVVPLLTEEVTEKEVETIITEVKKHQLRHLHDATYGSMLPVENLYQSNFEDYSALYIELSHPVSKKGLHLQPEGLYLRAFCKGKRSNLPGRYKEILAYAQEKGLTLFGYAYETGINETVIDSFDDYITQIEIPVRTMKNDERQD